MARKGPWVGEESWELSEFAENDIGQNGSAREGISQNESNLNGKSQNGKSQNGTIQNGAGQNGSSKNGFSNQNGGHCDGRGNGVGKNTPTADKVRRPAGYDPPPFPRATPNSNLFFLLGIPSLTQTPCIYGPKTEQLNPSFSQGEEECEEEEEKTSASFLWWSFSISRQSNTVLTMIYFFQV